MRIRDIARIGGFPCGEYNAVTDVKGVLVGQVNVHDDAKGAHTGVTGPAPSKASPARASPLSSPPRISWKTPCMPACSA